VTVLVQGLKSKSGPAKEGGTLLSANKRNRELRIFKFQRQKQFVVRIKLRVSLLNRKRRNDETKASSLVFICMVIVIICHFCFLFFVLGGGGKFQQAVYIR
jgi:hypothetical protein